MKLGLDRAVLQSMHNQPNTSQGNGVSETAMCVCVGGQACVQM